MTHRQVEVRIDISGRHGLPGTVEIAATVHLPDPECLPRVPVILFASPGGGFSRGYYDMHFPGHSGYSQAEHNVAAGCVLVAYDHLGTGDSSLVDPGLLTIEVLAAANDAAVRILAERMAKGTLCDGYPALEQAFHIGVGQSMGGCLTIVMQGRHQTFDATAVLGYSGFHTVPPQRDPIAQQGLINSTRALNRLSDIRTLSIAETTSPHTKDDMRYPHHWEDVPPDILDADTPQGYPFRRTADWPPPWRSASLPQCALIMLSPGCVAEEAAAITVPVLTAMGERDVCLDPHEEPSAYRNARDITLFIVPGMAHMHNFATTRRVLWDRLVDWSRTVSSGHTR